MNPLKMSAKFAAYVWYSGVRQGRATREEALRFAEENWVPFLPCAQEGWGKLLIRAARLRRARVRRGRGRRAARAAKGPLPAMALGS
jgi:hypothetical protein